MFLSDTKINDLLENGSLTVIPMPLKKDICPNAIRLHLDETIIKYEDQTVDPMKQEKIKYTKINISNKMYELKPGEFILGSTIQKIKTPRNIIGFLDGRSTLARLGVSIHITAAITDSLYEEERTITLEIYNSGNMKVILTNKMPIGSMLFSELDQDVAQKLKTKYKGQSGVTVANLGL